MRPATPRGDAGSLAGPGVSGPQPGHDPAAWWATGLALVPLFVLITVFGYVLVLSVGGVLASPVIDFPDYSDEPFLPGAVGLALVGLLVATPPFLVVCAVYLVVLRRLAARGWSERRLRRAAVGGGALITAPFIILIPIGVIFGMVVPLPGADAETRRRALKRASASAAGLLVALVPLSLIVPHVG